ncbi:MAG: hypothetical protein A3H98_10450 [Bacteroidetes bacterium RIFCSPLOWO2_02_FULL_36_8]|nr:MAG: hypothetical protein A3H98_10450 [Bacteroidetes bacterium RIFCSPLOWO2_02_FULL_36_8]OFY70939.1 MAG: hypothetical protein A3G23_12540 [Bacteroidetes bacterium RIFCSPLOWO2_12_FULL_37_12]
MKKLFLLLQKILLSIIQTQTAQWVIGLFLDLYNILKFTWFIVLFLFIGSFALLNVDQANDAFDALNNPKNYFNYLNIFFTLFSTVLWSFSNWYSSRILLKLESIPSYNITINIFLHKWLPRVFGIIPYIIVAIAFVKPLCEISCSFVILIFLAIFFFLFVTLRRRFYLIKDGFETKEMSFKSLDKKSKWVIILSIIFVILCNFVFLWYPVGKVVARWAGPASLIILGLAIWSFAGMVISFFDYRLKFPFSIAIFMTVFGFSYFNNNHQIRVDKERKYNSYSGIKSLSVNEYFKKWIESRPDKDKYSRYPVFIIAAEGGGIRAAYWTSSVLAKLQQENPAFFYHTFAISSVSGGTVGSAIFTSLYIDSVVHDSSKAKPSLELVRDILSEDFLSPLNAALIFPDLIQKFLPFSFGCLDRARWLEDSWADAYKMYTGLNTLDSNFLDLWKNSNSYFPALFMNGTKVETGEKTIMSNLKLTDTEFSDIIDLQEKIHKNTGLKTAMLLSARFPLVTPPGTITDSEHPCNDLYNVVDGGYKENSGLQTALSIVKIIYDIKKDSSNKIPEICINLIFLKNSDTELETKKAIKGPYEIRAPINAFLNSWDNNVIGLISITKNFFSLDSAILDSFSIFKLDRKEGILPLGWVLSSKAQKRINFQIDNISTLENKQSFKAVINRLNKKIK